MVTEQRLIDANDLLQRIAYARSQKDTRETEVLTCLDLLEQVINLAPTVDAAPVVHGWWISVDGEGKPCDEWDCSICERRLTFAEEMEAADVCELNHYCPNCGAKMDGGAPDA